MSESQITLDLKKKEKIKGIDVINVISQCISQNVHVGHYIANLVINGTVPISKGQRARLINLTRAGQLHWARRFDWNEVRAYIRILDKLESKD